MKFWSIVIVFIFFQYILPQEIRLILSAILLSWMVFTKRISNTLELFQLFGGIFFILLLGFLQGIGNKQWDISRDFLYVLQIVIYFSLGAGLKNYLKDSSQLVRLILILSLISSIIHISRFVMQPNLLGMSIEDLRINAGRGSDIEVVGIGILFSCFIKSETRVAFGVRRNLKTWGVMAFLIFSLLLYFSRTMFLSILILTFSINKIFDFRSKKYYIIFILIGVISNFLLENISFNTDIEIVNKILNSRTEVFSSNASQFSIEEINRNWRSYESYRALLFFEKGSALNKTIGSGLGTLVDLGLSIKLSSEMEMEKIPIFHNGYLFFLIKFGIIGVLVYFLFLLKISFTQKQIKKDYPFYYHSQRILDGLTVMMLVNTFTISGLINKDLYLVTILMGLFWGIQKHKLRLTDIAHSKMNS